MTKQASAFVLLFAAVLAQCALAAAQEPDNARLLDILVTSYPDHLAGHAEGVLIWKDGSRMMFDDGRRGRSLQQMLDAPSLRDQFYAPYRIGPVTSGPAPDVDPGRVRYEPFFTKMYGDCRSGGVTRHLVDITWLPRKWGRKIKVTRVNGIDRKLEAVSGELDSLPARFDVFLVPPAGGYACRPIAGTSRASLHGTGAAIDIAAKPSHYWRWAKPDANGERRWRNAIPMEIVAIFERHGFIWGGKWSHFDTMHFEYRPELIAAGK